MTHRPIKVDEITGVWSYLASIDWEERWLWGLLGFHVVCILCTWLTRRNFNVQIVFFLAYLLLARLAEYINEWAAENWKKFAKQQYFDSGGLFISIVFSGPLLLNCLVIVIFWVWSAGQMLIHVKRAQIKESRKAQAKTEEKKAN